MAAAELHEKAPADGLQLSADQMDLHLADLAEDFALPRATGVSLDDLVAFATPTASAPEVTSAASASDGSPAGFSFFDGLFRSSGLSSSSLGHSPLPNPPPASLTSGRATGRATASARHLALTAGKQSSVAPVAGAGGATIVPGSADGARRGRPAQTWMSRYQKVEEEFSQAGSTNVRFFGSECKAQLKTLARLSEDFAKRPNPDADLRSHEVRGVGWTIEGF